MLKSIKQFGELIYLITYLGVGQSVAQLDSFRIYIDEGLEQMYREDLYRTEDEHATRDPEHEFGRVG